MLSMTDAAPNGPPAMPFEPRPRRKVDPDDALGQFDASFVLMMLTLRQFVPALIDALGGEETPTGI